MFVSSLDSGKDNRMLSYIEERSLAKPTPPWVWTNDQLTQYSSNPQNLWIGKMENSELVATILYGSTDTAKEIFFLETHPNHLRKGHMTSLLKKFLEDLGGLEVWVDAHIRNHEALSLYNRMGFKKVGQRPGYYSDGGDSLLMTYADGRSG